MIGDLEMPLVESTSNNNRGEKVPLTRKAAARSPAKPVSRRVIPALLRLASVLRRSSSQTYKQSLQLNPTAWVIVALVGDHGPFSQSKLMQLTSIDKGQLSRGVSQLVEAGMLSVEAANGTRSPKLIRLTKKGSRVADRLQKLSLKREKRLLAGVTQEERNVLMSVMDKLLANERSVLENR